MPRIKKEHKPDPNEKILGIDYGDVNIGVAFGSSGLSASVKSIPAVNLDEAILQITRLAIESKISRIVVGLPLSDTGKPNAQTFKVKDFVSKLRLKVKFPVSYVNEFMTSKEALVKAVGYGVAKKNRSHLDSLAAEIIVQRYYSGESDIEKRLIR
jgi:putative transcription antitermination factor YqgF